MTLTRKGTRRIVVGDFAYRWAVRRRPTDNQAVGWTPLRIIVELAENPGAPLLATTTEAHGRNWVGLPPGSVTPATVAAAILQALAEGWQPTKPGPPFTMTLPPKSEP